MLEDIDLLEDILIQERSINLQTLSDVITLAVEIAREGREGRKVGTLFVISDERSRNLQATDSRPSLASS
jgi:diadenylate cyclase